MTTPPVIDGNIYNKYESNNPIAKRLMENYLSTLDVQLARTGNVSAVLEVGCGEGHITHRLARIFGTATVTGFDLSNRVVAQAHHPGYRANFACASAYKLPFPTNAFDLVVCVEVLEHLEQFEQALREINRVAQRFILISVPREPIWRILNMLRGAYLNDWGNTPGHVQHWSKSDLINLIAPFGEIKNVATPFPWTMALLKK